MPTPPSAYIGIDPGQKGALVLYQPGRKPTTLLLSLEGKSQPEEPYEWLKRAKAYRPDAFAVLEMIPKSIFGTDKASMSVLYGSYRELRMALLLLKFDFHEAIVAQPTKTWVREFMVPRMPGETLAEWKRRHQRAAQGVFKDASITPETSDAYLLAEYARRMKAGTLAHSFTAPPRKRKGK